MRGKIHMRPEEYDLRLSRSPCASAPPDQRFSPIRTTVAPVDKQQSHLVRCWQAGRVIHAPHLDAGSGRGLEYPRCDDQVPSEEDDSHLAEDGSDAIGVVGSGGTAGRDSGSYSPLPLFVPLWGRPSIT